MAPMSIFMSIPFVVDVIDRLGGQHGVLGTWLSSQVTSSSSKVETVCTGACLRNWKIVFATILFIEGLVFGHVVLLIRRQTHKSQHAFSVASSFGHALSAGVFFATGLMHILPEAIELLQDGENHDEEGHDEEEHNERNVLVNRWNHKNGLIDSSILNREGVEHGHENGFPWPFFIVIVAFYAMFLLEKIIIPYIFPSAALPTHVHDVEAGVKADVHDARNDGSRGHTNLPMSTSSQNDDFQCSPASEVTTSMKKEGLSKNGELEKRFASHAFAVAILQIVGLSVHSLFESMALGLSSDFTTVLNVFIATASHRWATSTAIAFTTASRLTYIPFLVAFIIFSVMVPIGVGIGAALKQMSPKVQGVLFAVSAGTFLYVGAFETMAESFPSGERRWMVQKFFVTILGAVIIISVTAILTSLGLHG